MQILTRHFKYDDNGRPLMILRKKQYGRAYSSTPRKAPTFAIRLEDVWQYSQDHNPAFRQHFFNICMMLCKLFELGLVTARKMAEIASVIEEGIDDLVKMPPQPTNGVCVGEVKLTERATNGDGEQSFTNDFIEQQPIAETIH